MLARKIAERLIIIGDEVNSETDALTVVELLEGFVASFDQGEQLTWRGVGRVYGALSRLLTQSVHSECAGEALEQNESWLTFSKFWKTVLRTVATWITDNGGWVSS